MRCPASRLLALLGIASAMAGQQVVRPIDFWIRSDGVPFFDPVTQQVMAFDGDMIRGWDGFTWRTRGASRNVDANRGEYAMDPVRGHLYAMGRGAWGVPVLQRWRGGSWEELGPAPGGSGPLVVDPLRDRIVTVRFLGATWQTWEWDGQVWTNTPAATPYLGEPHLVFDSLRQQALLFGYSLTYGAGYRFQLWSWNGVQWTQHAFGNGPVRCTDRHFLAEDAARGRLVFVNNCTPPETWEWDGSTCSLISTAGPAVRSGLVFDPTRGRVLMNGSIDGDLSRSDVWSWNGAAWQRIGEEIRPTRRFRHGSAYDSLRDRFVVFGGSTFESNYQWPTTFSADTWLWDGLYWHRAAPAVPPPARDSHGMTFHAASGQLLLFGGRAPTGALLGDTWLWDGTTWRQANPAMSPSPRRDCGMVYADAWARCILFGGRDANHPGGTNDTWEWDGAQWLSRAPVAVPPARFDNGLGYDPNRQRVVLTGGQDASAAVPGTWEWDGNNWHAFAATPPNDANWALAFLPYRNRVVCTADVSFYPCEWDGAGWQYSTFVSFMPMKDLDSRRGRLIAMDDVDLEAHGKGLATATMESLGCGGTDGTPVLGTTAMPRPMDPAFALELRTAQANTAGVVAIAFGVTSLPLGAGCEWQLAAPLTAALVVSDGRHLAPAPLRIPSTPDLRGFVLHAQAATLDSLAPLGFGVSGRLRLCIGD